MSDSKQGIFLLGAAKSSDNWELEAQGPADLIE